MAQEFSKVAGRIYTVSVHSDRAAEAKLLRRIRKAAPDLAVESCQSLDAALKKSENDERIVITGSLHFIGEAMEKLGFQAGKTNERELNDWSGGKGRGETSKEALG